MKCVISVLGKDTTGIVAEVEGNQPIENATRDILAALER